MSNYTKILESVKDNIPGNAGEQPGLKVRWAVLSNDGTAHFAFIDIVGVSPLTLLCPVKTTADNYLTFSKNSPLVSRGFVVGYLDITPNLVRCLI